MGSLEVFRRGRTCLVRGSAVQGAFEEKGKARRRNWHVLKSKGVAKGEGTTKCVQIVKRVTVANRKDSLIKRLKQQDVVRRA
jgi:hypothetical protein